MRPLFPSPCSCDNDPPHAATSILRRLRISSLRTTPPYLLFRQYHAVQPRLELVLILSIILLYTFLTFLWSKGLHIVSLVELVVVVPMIFILLYATTSYPAFVMYMLLACVAVATTVDLGHGMYTVGVLRLMVVLFPAVFLPFHQSAALVILVLVEAKICSAVYYYKHYHHLGSQPWGGLNVLAEDSIVAKVGWSRVDGALRW